MTRPTLAYIGLGLMGAPMTRRLIAAGYTVHVWNRSRDKLQPAIDAGAIPAATPRAAVEAADLAFMCLFDAHAVEAVVFGSDGIAAAAGAAKVLVDHASIRPDKTREFAARLKAANGMDWIDAPVSGGVKGATEGTLAIMCGGEPAAYERARPVMAAYAANVNLMGPSGAGQVTKLCNQVICGSTMVVIAEAVRLAQNAGVDARLLPRALAGGFADSKPFQILVPRMIDRPAESIGAADTMLKDLDTAVDLGRDNGTPLPIAGLAAQLLRTLAAQGKGGEEISAIIDLYQART